MADELNELQTSPDVANKVIPEPLTKGRTRKNKVIKLELTEDQKKDILTMINDEMGKILTEYQEADFYNKIETWQKDYDLVKEEIAGSDTGSFITGGSNRSIALVAVMSDMVASRGRRQTCDPDPMILLEQEEELEETQKIHEREEYLDYIMRKKTDYEMLTYLKYRKACIQGASIVHCPFNHKEEYFEVSETQEKPVVKIHGADPYIVDLKKFFARLKIKDFERHRVIAESRDFGWMDIEDRRKSGFYDEKAVEDLKTKAGKEYEKQDYKIYEAIVKADIMGTGKIRRYIITFDDTYEIILRAIYFPYKHMQVPYTVTNAIPKDDSWWGYSFSEKLEDIISAAEAFLNSAINEFTIAHLPTVMTNDSDFDGGRLELEGMNVVKFHKGTVFTTLKYDYSPIDRLPFLSWLVNFSELITGVGVSLASGAETPHDPRAPAAKTAMKMQATTMRIEDIVISLQASDTRLAEQIEWITYQYPQYEDKSIEYWTAGRKRIIPLDFIEKKVRYIVHGSRLSFDRVSDALISMQTTDYIMQKHPETWADVEVKYTLLQSVINNTQGSVKKYKDIILKPLELLVKVKKEKEKAMQQIFDAIKQQGGTPTNEQLIALQQLGLIGQNQREQHISPQITPPPTVPPTTPAVIPPGIRGAGGLQ